MAQLGFAVAAAAVSTRAYSIVKAIKSAIEESRGAEDSLPAFANETSVLADTLNLIDTALLQDLKTQSTDLDAKQYNSCLTHVIPNLQKVITDCEDTLVKLHAIVGESSEKLRTTLLSGQVTAFKLNLRSEEIDAIRHQIQAYTSAMQMTLSMVNISLLISHNQPSPRLQPSLQEELASFEETKEMLELNLASTTMLRNSFDFEKKADNLNDYLRVSGSIRSKASLYLGSLDGNDPGNSHAKDLASVLNSDIEHRLAIQSWRDDQSHGFANKETFNTKLNIRRLDLAERKLNANAYYDAETLLTTYLSNLEASEDVLGHQIVEAQTMLAQVYCGQTKRKEAVDLLLSVLNSGNPSETQKSYLKHYLAETYLKDSKPKDALPWAIAACEARHNVQPESFYFESCLLASQVLTALGETVEAELYMSELPPSYQSPELPPSYHSSIVRHDGLQTPLLDSGGITNALSSTQARDFRTHSYITPNQPQKARNMSNLPLEADADAYFPEMPSSTTSLAPLVKSSKSRQISLPNFRKRTNSNNNSAIVPSSGRLSIELRASAFPQALKKMVHNHTEIVWSVEISPDSHTLVSGSADYTMKIWDIESHEVRKTLTGHSKSVNSVAFSPDGRIIASASSDKTVKLWDTNTGNLCRTLADHGDLVNTVKFSSDGKLLASASGAAIESVDNRILIWNVATGERLKSFAGHFRAVKSVAFSPDDQRVVSGSYDGTLKLWDIKSATILMTFGGHSGWVSSVTFSPDGHYIASASWDLSIKYWNASTGALLRTCKHDRPVSSLAFLPDNQTTVSVDRTDIVTLCTATNGSHSSLKGKHRGLLSVAVAKPGHMIACGSVSKSVETISLDNPK